jgi:hypothetical protein
VRYSFKEFQEAVRVTDGEAGQRKVLPDFSERAQRPQSPKPFLDNFRFAENSEVDGEKPVYRY